MQAFVIDIIASAVAARDYHDAGAPRSRRSSLHLCQAPAITDVITLRMIARVETYILND
jgi:hypothetical protein